METTAHDFGHLSQVLGFSYNSLWYNSKCAVISDEDKFMIYSIRHGVAGLSHAG